MAESETLESLGLGWAGEQGEERKPMFLLLLKRGGDGHARGIKCRM